MEKTLKCESVLIHKRKKHRSSGVPAHLIEEAVGFCHAVELMFVLLQQIHVALLWNKLQQLKRQKNTFDFTFETMNKAKSLRTCYSISESVFNARPFLLET